MENVERLLLVRDPWATLLLSGYKTWEIRGEKTSIRGTVAIGKSGENQSLIYGVVDLVDCIGPLTLRNLQENFNKHCDPDDTRKKPYKSVFAWVVENPRSLKRPIPFVHKSGWVKWGRGSWSFEEGDFIDPEHLHTLPSPRPTTRKEFLAGLEDDLSGFGIALRPFELTGQTVCAINASKFLSATPAERKTIIQNGFSLIQKKNRELIKDSIEETRQWLLDQEYIADEPVPLHELNPMLEIVASSRERAIHTYCREQQNLPSGKSIGKIVDVLVWQMSQHGKKQHLIGAVGMGSAAYSASVRDNRFGWNTQYKDGRDVKEKALRCIPHINCITAAPPYDQAPYRLTKLLALVPFSEQVVDYYEQKHKSSLLAVTSTSGYSGGSPLWIRISLNSLLNSNSVTRTDKHISRDQTEAFDIWPNPAFPSNGRRNRRHDVFYSEGEIGGNWTSFLSRPTQELARELCATSGALARAPSLRESVHQAFKHVGLRLDLISLPPREYYIGALDNRCIEHLRDGTAPKTAPAIDWAKWLDLWRRKKAIR